MKKILDLYLLLITIQLSLFISACNKHVEVEAPANQLLTEVVFKNDSTAMATVTAVYSNMMQSSTGIASGTRSISLLTGLSSDEFTSYSADANLMEFSDNAINAGNSFNLSIWTEFYKYIYWTNATLEGVANSTTLTPSVISQVNGEAKFLRAFCYFYLVNLYADTPLVVKTDYRLNASAPRAPVEQVYSQIISDLKAAQTLLSDSYLSGANTSTTERIRPNKGAASALLARVYLYTENWVNAESEATSVINNTARYGLAADLNNVFLKNSNEAIWQLMPVVAGRNTFDAATFVLTAGAGTAAKPVALSASFYNGFTGSDMRKSKWVGTNTVGTTTYYFPNKYKVHLSNQPLTEYLTVLRLAEQYLIRSEARAKQNNLAGAIADLNVIRARASLTALPTTLNQEQVLLAVEQERRIELFSEWGHRWFDLKRMNRSDAVLAPVKGSSWQATDVNYPIPQLEILSNPFLIQNQGYRITIPDTSVFNANVNASIDMIRQMF